MSYSRCIYIGCLVYADDMIVFVVGKAHNITVDNLKIGHDVIAWKNSVKYLGVYFEKSHTLLIDSEITIRKFCAAANAIHSHVKYVSEITMLFLSENFCLPLLTYACETLLQETAIILTQLNVCWNRVFWKAFHVNN